MEVCRAWIRKVRRLPYLGEGAFIWGGKQGMFHLLFSS